jgi:hypothetical protein
VSRLLSKAAKIALARLTEDVQRHKALQHERLDHIISEAMQGWERSKKDKRSGVKRTDSLPPEERSGAGELVKAGEQVTQTAEEQVGDPTFLQEAREALADQRRIWGLDAQPVMQPAGASGVLVINTIEARPPSRPVVDDCIEVEAR